MSKPWKILRWLIKGLVLMVIVVVAVMILAASLINLEAIRLDIVARISRSLGGKIQYRAMELAYFPRPHALIHTTEIVLPDSFTIKIHRLKIYPKILPLFKGKLEFADVTLEYPDYFMKLPPVMAGSDVTDKILSVEDTINYLTTTVRALPQFHLPEVNLKIKYGRANLVDPSGYRYKLREINADYERHPTKLKFAVESKSNLWQRAVVSGSLDPSSFKGRARVELSQFDPRALYAYLFPRVGLKLADARADLAIDFKSEGTGRIRVDVTGKIPVFELRRGEKQLVLKGSTIGGSVRIGGDKTEVILNRLGFEDPRLTVAGSFSFDEPQQDIQLTIRGSQIDVASTRAAALVLAGDKNTIQNVFEIIRGGQVPWMTVTSRVSAISDLAEFENIVIQGQMTQGKIFIPVARLDLEEVIGDATISKGVLRGKNLRARMGNSRGQNGTIKIGLTQKAIPFGLNIPVQADLSQLPPVLGRIVKDQNFLRELGHIDEFTGTAEGVLKLGENLANLKATVEVSKVDLSARYAPIPHPIKIDGGRFRYEGSRIELQDFNVKIGNSTLSALSSVIDWTQTADFKAASKTAAFDMNELISYLGSFDALKKSLKDVASVRGNISVQPLNIDGPLFNPQKWRFQTQGIIDNLVVTSQKLPTPLQIRRGDFSWYDTQLSVNGIQASLGQSTLSGLSAGIDWGIASAFEVQAASLELVTDEIIPWLSTFQKFQPVLKKISASGGTIGCDDLNLKGPPGQPALWQYQFTCKMQNLVLKSPVDANPALITTVTSGAFTVHSETVSGAAGSQIDLATANLIWGENHLQLSGKTHVSKKDIVLDMSVSADAIAWSQLKRLLESENESHTKPLAPGWQEHLRGRLRVHSGGFTYETYTIQNLEAEVSFLPDEINIAVARAILCNIALRGVVNISGQTMDIYFIPTAADESLSLALFCLTDKEGLATGQFDFNGELKAKTTADDWPRSLGGRLEFAAKEGRIYRFGLLAKILAILNVTEIYRGEIPDLTGEGFAYRSMKVSANIQAGKIVMQECAIDGASMGIACEGSIDIPQKKMNLTILVAPFKTADRIVEYIPLVSEILGGKLISIPFRAKGDLEDPDVIPLPPKAVGSGVLGILERTLKLPITIIQPVLPKGKNGKTDKTQ